VPVLDAVVEVLRHSDGRPMPVSRIAELVLQKAGFDGRGGAAEVSRQVRAALVRDSREREAEGLRARFLNFGGGQFALVEKKLEPELAAVERELAEKAARLRDMTRNTLRRRLPRLAPAAFEALGRALVDKLGISQLELVRRGEGVAYFGGVRTPGATTLKVLVAMRAGDAEISRKAVGELKAGMQIRAYDEGLLLAAGRPSAEGTAEAKSAPNLTVHDGLSMASLSCKHGLGVRRLLVPVEVLDVELLQELQD
jgi:hypothetical protein